MLHSKVALGAGDGAAEDPDRAGSARPGARAAGSGAPVAGGGVIAASRVSDDRAPPPAARAGSVDTLDSPSLGRGRAAEARA